MVVPLLTVVGEDVELVLLPGEWMIGFVVFAVVLAEELFCCVVIPPVAFRKVGVVLMVVGGAAVLVLELADVDM